MANRFKLVLLLLIVLGLGILFIQNQQPLSLQLLCPDANQFCLYQTRSLPLAAWMGLFIFVGMITSFIWQLLNRFASPVTRPKNYVRTDNLDLAQPPTNRQRTRIQDWDNEPEDFVPTNPSMSSEYEVHREPESITRSGSTYSYKFKEKNDTTQDPKNAETSARGEFDENISNENIDLTKNKDDEEWI